MAEGKQQQLFRGRATAAVAWPPEVTREIVHALAALQLQALEVEDPGEGDDDERH